MIRKYIANNLNANPCFLMSHRSSHLSLTSCDARVKIMKPAADLQYVLGYCRFTVVQHGRLFTVDQFLM